MDFLGGVVELYFRILIKIYLEILPIYLSELDGLK